MPERELSVLLDGLAFPECPRWHRNRLWFSDLHDRSVWAVTVDGQAQRICEVPGQPSGLGWLPDGGLLIVSMTERRLYRMAATTLLEIADLSPYFEHNANDMVVDGWGRAYIGCFGFDLEGGGEPTATRMVCVDTNERPADTWVVVEGLLFPNGCVVTPDNSTLIVAESFGQRLSAYDILEDGSLDNPRVWADLRPNVPDGICLDARGAVWVADPVNNGVLRVEAGMVSEWIPTERHAYACVLGGPDGRTLYLCTAETSNPARTVELRSGRIETCRVDVPGASFVAEQSA